MQTRTLGGSIALLAAAGMLVTSIGNEIAALDDWAMVLLPSFVGQMALHVGTVIATYVAGQLIPSAQRLLPPEDRK